VVQGEAGVCLCVHMKVEGRDWVWKVKCVGGGEKSELGVRWATWKRARDTTRKKKRKSSLCVFNTKDGCVSLSVLYSYVFCLSSFVL